jgi:hypothetical protein
LGSVLSYEHAAGTIHLRLRNATEILRKMAEERGEEEGEQGKDMLVRRLEDSIEKALVNVREMGERGSGCLVDEETDRAARVIEDAEREAKNVWLENHGTIDEDGR